MRFLVHGSIAYDILLGYDGSFVDGLDAKHLDQLSAAYVTQHFARHHGGTAANISWNLHLLSQVPLLVGTVGSDGGPYLALLRERGIATDFVEEKREHVTATAIVATDDFEHQITFFHPGADAAGALPDLADERDDIAYAIVSPRDATLMLQASAQCARLNIPYLFDPGQQSLAFTREDLQKAVQESRGLIVNEYEWGLASTKLDWTAKQVVSSCGLLIVTRGDKGLTLHTEQGSEKIPACKSGGTVNPVGAGDALRAGILTGLGKKWSLVECARLGAALGSFVVEQEGTLLDSLDMDELRLRAKVAYEKDLPHL